MTYMDDNYVYRYLIDDGEERYYRWMTEYEAICETEKGSDVTITDDPPRLNENKRSDDLIECDCGECDECLEYFAELLDEEWV
jgi:hypothetical protein